MNSLVSYGSDDDNGDSDNSAKFHKGTLAIRRPPPYGGGGGDNAKQSSLPQRSHIASGRSRPGVDDGTNYDHVQMDLSEMLDPSFLWQEDEPLKNSANQRARASSENRDRTNRPSNRDSGHYDSSKHRDSRDQRDRNHHGDDNDRDKDRDQQRDSRSNVRDSRDRPSNRGGRDDKKDSRDGGHRAGDRDRRCNSRDRDRDNRDHRRDNHRDSKDSSDSRRDKDRDNSSNRNRDNYNNRERDNRDRGDYNRQRDNRRKSPTNQNFNNYRGGGGRRFDRASNKMAQLEKLGIEIKAPENFVPPASGIYTPDDARGNNGPYLGNSGGLGGDLGAGNAVGGDGQFFMPGVTGRFRDQIERRKQLWAKSKQPDIIAPKPTAAPIVTAAVSPTADSHVVGRSTWAATTFAQDTDGRQANKFKRLMGIRGEDAGAGDGASTTNKRQEEMFSSMEAQYEVARTVTHTMRGVGLGFSSAAQGLYPR